MRLVNQDGKIPVLMLRGYIFQNILKFVYHRDDDLLAFVQQIPQSAGILGPAHRGGHLHELPDGVFDLFIQVDAVRHDDDGVKDIPSRIVCQGDQLMCKPCNGI